MEDREKYGSNKLTLEGLKPGTPIWIHWLDSCGGSCGWGYSGHFNKKAKAQNLRCKTLGFVLATTGEFITLCGSKQDAQSPGGNFNYLDEITIPLVAIRRWGLVKMEGSES